MAKQHCREVSPHATDEGKVSIKKKLRDVQQERKGATFKQVLNIFE